MSDDAVIVEFCGGGPLDGETAEYSQRAPIPTRHTFPDQRGATIRTGDIVHDYRRAQKNGLWRFVYAGSRISE